MKRNFVKIVYIIMIIFMCCAGTLNATLHIGNMDMKFILQSYLTNAEIARSKGDCMSAIEFYMKYLKYKKDDAKVWNNLGICLYKEGFYKKALEAFKKAYFYKRKSLYLYNQALCFIILGKKDRACKIFKTLKIYEKPFLEKYPYFKKYCKDLKKDSQKKKVSCGYIFVYGTLKRGERAHNYLETAYYVGEGEIEGFCLYDLGEYPAIKRCKGKVKGEVYLVDENTLKTLDEYEGTNYRRIEVEVKIKKGGKIKAWCYEYLGEVKEENKILNGKWKGSKNNNKKE